MLEHKEKDQTDPYIYKCWYTVDHHQIISAPQFVYRNIWTTVSNCTPTKYTYKVGVPNKVVHDCSYKVGLPQI